MRGVSRATLYVIPGSHPAMTARRMLEHKGIDYRRIDLMPVVSRGVLKVLRFPGITIPSLRIDGRRITGSREISKALDEVQPDPPLFPADPADRVQVEDAERWADEIPQDGVRRILWNAIKRDRKPLRSFLDGARIGVPHGLAVATAAPIIAAELKINDVTDEAVEADLAAFPGWLDRMDDWIAGGVLGSEPPNAADFQVAGVLGLAMTMDDLRPFIEDRPCGALAKRLIPDFPGRVPPVLPPEWLAPLRAGTVNA
jgi:glutathione S-transferase